MHTIGLFGTISNTDQEDQEADFISEEEFEMWANYIVYSLIHAKKELELNGNQVYLMVNTLFSLFLNNDSRFSDSAVWPKTAELSEEEEVNRITALAQ
jgi:hypothetical protein